MPHETGVFMNDKQHDMNSSIDNVDSNDEMCVRVLSWNIHDAGTAISGPKWEDPEFTDIIKGHSVICFQETKRDMLIPDYQCFNQLRRSSRSGGLCIAVHKSLKGHKTLLKTKSEDIMALTIALNTEERNSDFKLTIVNVYDSPEISSFKIRKKVEAGDFKATIEELCEFFQSNVKFEKNVLLLGDFNARTGSIGTSAHRADDPSLSYNPNFPLRCSKDHVMNNRGRIFLEATDELDLTILNGYWIGDVLGEQTCLNYNGASTVDYMAVSSDLLSRVDSFCILDQTGISDHRPSSCCLRLLNRLVDSTVLLEQLEDVPKRHKWDQDSPDCEKLFQEALSTTVDATLDQLLCPCDSASDVIDLNKKLVDLYNSAAGEISVEKPEQESSKGKKRRNHRRPKMKPLKRWFDAQCIQEKRKLRVLAKKYGKKPLDPAVRCEFYDQKRSYRILIRAKKSDFISKLSEEVKNGKGINWCRLKELKSLKKTEVKLDVFDMRNFVTFFRDLYSKNTIDGQKIKDMNEAISKNLPYRPLMKSLLSDQLDTPIEMEELSKAIKRLKTGKAVSEDRIANEFLKSSEGDTLIVVRHLFNEALRIGIYPWSTSLVTPLHKKGSPYDPNNYRAIAVASNLGKLFSSILLNRLTSFRSSASPDTANQLGFCSGAQTTDHCLTLVTCIQKYVTANRNRLYGCFVDFAKAFDTVNRDALLYKLWELGIRGRFFAVMENMYKNSSAKIKLLSKLSESIDVLVGTEQGHPMSPELFKVYIHQLSEELSSIPGISVPVLSGVEIGHLLWADDLILLALDKSSLQKQLDTLHSYCSEWGLSVNIKKTAVTVFNPTGKLLKESKTLTYGGSALPSCREYCYLGTIFTLSGSLKSTQRMLKTKGLKAYFSMTSSLDSRSVPKDTLMKLFDSLVLPVVAYGSNIWLAESKFTSTLTRTDVRQHAGAVSDPKPLLPNISQDPVESLHLKFLKWTIGVGAKTSNTAVWGDTGKMPLAIELYRQLLNYLNRLQAMSRDCNNRSLVKFAFQEQKAMGLTWFKGISGLYETTTGETLFKSLEENISLNSTSFKNLLAQRFLSIWETERKNNKKLGFYNSVKLEFGTEPYLTADVGLSFKEIKRTAQLRTCSHRFAIETGRHGEKRKSVVNRACSTCSDLKCLELLYELPFALPLIVESELHVLRTCPLYHGDRLALSDETKTSLFADPSSLFAVENIRESARFILKIHRRRFPKKTVVAGKGKKGKKD